MTWGYHTLFDCESCSKETLTEENIRSFISNIVPTIGMISYGDPMIAHFATHDPDAAGYSFCQMIETSNITGHFVDKTVTVILIFLVVRNMIRVLQLELLWISLAQKKLK